jgi:hypothetical protein
MEVHEQTHLWQLQLLQEEICKGVKDGWQIAYVGGKGLAYYDLEIEAYAEQIKCLFEMIRKAPKCEEYLREELALRQRRAANLEFDRIMLRERMRRAAVPGRTGPYPSTGDWYQGPPRNGIEEWWQYERGRQPIWSGPGRPRLTPYPIKIPERIREQCPVPVPGGGR